MKRQKQKTGFRRLTPEYALKNGINVKNDYQEKYWKGVFKDEEIKNYNEILVNKR